MAKLQLRSVQLQAYRFVFIPAAIVLVISILLMLFKGALLGYSVFLGGVVWAIPNGFVAHKLFSNVSARAINQIITTFYFAEAIKLLLTVVLLIGIIKFLPVKFGYFLLGYLVAQISFWVIPNFINKKS